VGVPTEWACRGGVDFIMICVETLEQRRLLSANPGPLGLSATYFSDAELNQAVVNRVDPGVHFHFGKKAPVAGISDDVFSVQWTGAVTPRRTGVYTFATKADSGVRLIVDGQSIVDDWTSDSATQDRGQITLQAGVPYSIELDYHHDAGRSMVILSWARHGQSLDWVPRANLTPVFSEVGVPNMPVPPLPPNPPAIVATYTVDPAGAIKTISAAARLVKPGDVVLIMPGTYHESVKLTTSGTPDKPITFEAAAPNTVMIDGTGFLTVINSNWGATKYITLKNINVNHCANPLSTEVAAVGSGTGWMMQNVVVDGADGTGIDVWGDSVTLLNCTAENCGRAGLSGTGASNVLVKDCITSGNNTKKNDPGDNAGAGKWNKCDSITIDGLDSYDNIGTGLWFDYNNTNITIQNCKIHDNHGLVHDYEGVGLSIELDTGPVLIQNNQFYGNTGADIGIRSSRHVTIQNNSLKGSYLDIQDWPRGEDYTDQDFNIFSNTFDGTKVFASGGTWNFLSTVTKQITFAGNTYVNSPAAMFTWGGEDMTLSQAKAKLGVEMTAAPATLPGK
jgi:hypothetical protein